MDSEKYNQFRLIISPIHVQETNFQGDQNKRGEALNVAIGN